MHFSKLLGALVNSISGMKFLLKERAFVQEIILGLFLCAVLFLSRNTTTEMLYIFSSYLLVLITESLNTCIETVIDRISSEKNPLSKKAKDIGSAAVFVSLLHLGTVSLLLIKF